MVKSLFVSCLRFDKIANSVLGSKEEVVSSKINKSGLNNKAIPPFFSAKSMLRKNNGYFNIFIRNS